MIRCIAVCGLLDSRLSGWDEEKGHRVHVDHVCILESKHQGPHQFIATCGKNDPRV